MAELNITVITEQVYALPFPDPNNHSEVEVNRSCIDQQEYNKTLENITQISTDKTESAADIFCSIVSVDLCIAVLIILLTTISIVGNTVSMSYFWRRRKRTIYNLIYLLISALDALTSATSFPVITSLLNSRDPVLFNNKVICNSWPVLFYLLVRLSMLLVVFLSIFRTLAIVKPLQRKDETLQRRKLVLGMLAYSVFLIGIDLAFLLSGNESGNKGVAYIKYNAFCEIFTQAHLTQDSGPSWLTSAYQVLLQLEFIVPCLIVFSSFCISTAALLKRKAMLSEDEARFRKISVTIGLFTALFLACYLPCFLVQLSFLVFIFKPGIIDTLNLTNSGFQKYGYLLVQLVLPLLNSACNPCLYLSRMTQYRNWVIGRVRRVIQPRRTVAESEIKLKESETVGVPREGKIDDIRCEAKHLLNNPDTRTSL